MAPILLVFACLVGGGLAAVDLRPYNATAAYMFGVYDKNGDAILTKDEFEAPFNAYDFNGDKVIERHEYVCMITESNVNLISVSHAIYDDYDSDGDHRLEKTDFDAFYKKMDTNGNDQVSREEYVTYWTKLLADTEHHSLHGVPHKLHTDKYCQKHGHHH